MSITPAQNSTPRERQRQQVWLIGALGGLVFGLIGAYLFNQASGDDEAAVENRTVAPGEIITLVVAAFAFMRQIIELGRPDPAKQGSKRRR